MASVLLSYNIYCFFIVCPEGLVWINKWKMFWFYQERGYTNWQLALEEMSLKKNRCHFFLLHHFVCVHAWEGVHKNICAISRTRERGCWGHLPNFFKTFVVGLGDVSSLMLLRTCETTRSILWRGQANNFRKGCGHLEEPWLDSRDWSSQWWQKPNLQ